MILFTFGSTTKGKTVNLEMRNAFKNAFAELQERVIWKFDDKIDGVTDNVMVSNWLPQRDILGRNFINLFSEENIERILYKIILFFIFFLFSNGK